MIQHGVRFRTPQLLLLALLLGSQSIAILADGWVSRTPLPSARWAHGAVAVNGSLYVLGGQPDNGGTVARQVSSYDPATDTWTVVSGVTAPHTNPGVTAVNGTIYLVGGYDASAGYTMSKVESYDPVTRIATVKAPLNVPRHALGAAAIDGIVYAVGGDGVPGVGALETVEAFDPATNSWSYRADMPTARMAHAVAALDGVLYATGGRQTACVTLASVEAYDPSTDTWSSRAPMLTPRVLHSLVAANGRLYAIGGVSCGGASIATVESYDPATDTWTPESSLPSPRGYGAAAAIGGVIYNVGGAVHDASGRGVGFLNNLDALGVAAVTDTTAPVISDVPPNQSYEATGASGAVANWAAPTAQDDVDGIVSVSCSPASGSTFALGPTTVTCSAEDAAGNSSSASFTVTVADTTAPVISSVTPSSRSLWPPNHRLVPITVTVQASDIVSAPVCSITGIASSEPDNGLGDGDTANDIQAVSGLTVRLRAERGGRGSGRTYTIDVGCVDAAGNASASQTTVSVPKSQAR